MGARKRSKNQPVFVHSKQRNVEDDDGWTHVVGGNRNTHASSAALKSGDAFFSSTGVYYVHSTLEELRIAFERHRTNWNSEQACADLTAMVETMQDDEHVDVTNLICLGLGSLQGSSTKQSHTQLAALLTIQEVLNKKQEVKIIAQEPAFTDLDKELLVELGVEVVEDPKGFDFIEENSLVFAVHCYPSLYLQVADKPLAAAMVCNDMTQVAESAVVEKMLGSEGREKVLGMTKNCSERTFPDVRDIFSSTKLYWRKKPSSED